jgi:hypothetical protein
MSELNTLLAAMDFSRARLLGILETIEKSGQPIEKVLAWRPGPGRAHIGWQAMHCAATHDRYVNVRLKGGTVSDPALSEAFAGGSTPSDTNVPTLADIRSKLETTFAGFKAFLKTADLSTVTEFPGGVKRTVAESVILLTWHEGHHQGQIHLTWNLYKAAHGVA